MDEELWNSFVETCDADSATVTEVCYGLVTRIWYYIFVIICTVDVYLKCLRLQIDSRCDQRPEPVEYSHEQTHPNSFDQHSLANLQSIANTNGYAVHDVPGDGDCLFHAINFSMQNLSIGTIDISTVREKLKDFMQDNVEKYIDFVSVESDNSQG